jgi:AmmeMemoRadiSam system protein A
MTATPESDQLDDRDRRELLRIARATLREHLSTGYLPPGSPHRKSLLKPGGAFVTIHVGGELRGCMGRLDPAASVWSNVGAAAAMAAARDPRFLPVSAGEVDRLELEVSVLGPFVDIPDPEAFDPLVHGIVVERGLRRALLLPQVAREQGWGRQEPLEAVCWKAGLDPDSWREHGTFLQVFSATVFGEDELATGEGDDVERREVEPASTKAPLPA